MLRRFVELGTHCVVDDLAFLGDTENLDLYPSDGSSAFTPTLGSAKPYEGIVLAVGDHLKYLCKANHYPRSDRNAIPDFKVEKYLKSEHQKVKTTLFTG